MRTNFVGGIIAVIVVAALIVGYSSVFSVYQTNRRWWSDWANQFA